jgi:ribosomal protein S27E
MSDVPPCDECGDDVIGYTHNVEDRLLCGWCGLEADPDFEKLEPVECHDCGAMTPFFKNAETTGRICWHCMVYLTHCHGYPEVLRE